MLCGAGGQRKKLTMKSSPGCSLWDWRVLEGWVTAILYALRTVRDSFLPSLTGPLNKLQGALCVPGHVLSSVDTT